MAGFPSATIRQCHRLAAVLVLATATACADRSEPIHVLAPDLAGPTLHADGLHPSDDSMALPTFSIGGGNDPNPPQP